MEKRHTKTLAILHNVFLTENQRVNLNNGDSVEVTGVSVPVWFYKGNTSEPAIEVFCKYLLTNIPDDYPVTQMDDGYKINMPQGDQTGEVPLAEDGPALKVLVGKYEGMSTNFRRYNKVTEKGQRTNVVHTVEINDMETLEESLSV